MWFYLSDLLDQIQLIIQIVDILIKLILIQVSVVIAFMLQNQIKMIINLNSSDA